MSTNQSLAIVLLVDADRHTADASTRVERIMRYMAMARGKPISGRWPQGVTRQREEIEDALRSAVDLLDRVQVAMPQARAKVNHNPSLSEAILADIGQYLARSLTQTERVVRLLVEAGIGRD